MVDGLAMAGLQQEIIISTYDPTTIENIPFLGNSGMWNIFL